MSNSIQNMTHAAQRKMAEKLVETALSKVNKDREESFLKIVDLAETFEPMGINIIYPMKI